MRFITSTFFAIAALAGLVMAGENPIIYPDGSSKIVAGTPFTITWTPTTVSTCKFTLRRGASDNLDDVEVIVSGAPNTGTYQWTPAKTLPAGNNYAIMITDSLGNVNYTPLITIQSDVKSSSVSSSSKTTAQVSSTTSAASSAISAPATMTQSYSNSTLITSVTSGYTNATSTGNLTRSTSHTTTPTSAQEPVATATGAASGLLKSPLALVVCVLGAVLYLN